jgi:hypothetical protein
MREVLRPLSFGELLDGGFTLYRRNFATLFGIALLLQVPVILFWLLVPVLLRGTSETAAAMLPLLLTPYTMFAFVLGMGALTAAAATAYGGDTPGIGSALRHGLRRWLPLAVVLLITFPLIFVGMVLLLVPGLVLLAMWFATYPVIVVEGRGPLAAMGRSQQLSKGGRLRILGITLVAWLITMLPSLAIMMFIGVGAGAQAVLAGDPSAMQGLWVTSLMQVASSLGSALTMPFLLIITLLLYYDRRARTEAPDLESAAESLRAVSS